MGIITGYPDDSSTTDNDKFLTSDASGATKLTPASTVKAYVLPAGGIATANLADDSVTDAKLDYPRWWQEIGRTTLGSAGDTISVTSLPSRKYLYVVVNLLNSGALDAFMRFNNDSAANYAHRSSANGAADTSTASTLSIPIDSGSFPLSAWVQITNNPTQEKGVYMQAMSFNATGAANIPGRTERSGKWSNTSVAITRVDVINVGAGDFAIGSEVVVLGHD